MVIPIAVVEFDKKDLDRLVGRKLTEEDYRNKLPMLGAPLDKADEKKVYYEISPNRPDMYSVEGFARAAKNFLGLSKSVPSFRAKPGKVIVSAGTVAARPYIVSAVVRNVKLSDDVIASLMQLQEKLHDTIGRKRKKVAIGMHDMDKAKPPFYYRAVDPEFSFVPLDMKQKMTMREIGEKHPKGADYIHTLDGFAKWPVITDKNGNVLSFPPVINGELTRVTEKTKTLFIDITGTSEIAINQALNILVAALSDRGFAIETVETNGKHTPNLEPKKIPVNMDYVNKLLDTDFTRSELKDILAKMCLGFDGSSAIIPPYRTDIMHQIDITEDVAIGKGYGYFEPRIPRVATIAKRNDLAEFSCFLRDAATGLGLQETVGMILTNMEDGFGKMNAPEEESCETVNPVSVECTICRKRILPSLLKVLANNKNRDYPQRIFEIGDVVLPDKTKETGAAVVKMLAAAISNSAASYEEASSYLDALMRELGVDYKLRKAKNPSFIDGRCAEIVVNNARMGVIGEIHPQVLANWNIEKPVAAFEVDIEGVFQLMNKN